jgi:type II secretory ATPase GspE/PulE/Tfp pilus assembly ATPase PilB-like protein
MFGLSSDRLHRAARHLRALDGRRRGGALILKSSDAQSIKRAAVEQGMDTLRDDGARKVLLGLTTVEEVLAATQEDVAVE